MGFPTTGILDNFNRANEGPPPSSNWTTDGGNFTVLNNQCVATSAGGGASYWNTSFGPDVEAYVTIATKEILDGNSSGLRVRYDIALNNFYYVLTVESVAGTDTIELKRRDGGVATLIGGPYNQEITNGDSIGISAIGSTITAWYKSGAGAWTKVGSVTDTTYNNSGKISLFNDSTTSIHDDFGGGSIPVFRKTLSPIGTRTGSRQVRCC